MSQVLYRLLKERIYKDQAIKAISHAAGKPVAWIFDFKGNGLRKDFLQEFSKNFWRVSQEYFPGGVQVGGMESGALPLLAGIAAFAPEAVVVNSFYLRKSRKKNDLANLVEGEIVPNIPIVLVDDILNSGTTIRKQVKIIEELGYQVAAVFVCLRYRNLLQYQDLLDKGIRLLSLFELDDFKDELPIKNILPDEPDNTKSEKYVLDYRVRLTDKPNRYVVVPKSAPILVGEYLYLGVDGGAFYCLRSFDGSIIWKYQVPFGANGKYIFSSPCVYQDVVIFGAYDGNLYCLDRFTGKRRWVFSDADWIGSSPCVDEAAGIVYVGLEFGLFLRQGGLVAIRIETGKVVWKNYDVPGLVHASPAYNKKTGLIVCGSNNNVFYALDAKTGKVRWQFKALGEIKYGAIFDDDRGLVIFGSMDNGMYVLQVRDGLLWHRFEARFGFYSTPVLQGDLVILGSLDKVVYCFNLATKKVQWTFETAGRIFASPIVSGESVFIGSNDGRLYEMDIQSGRVFATVQVTERIVNRIQIEYTSEKKKVLYIPTHMGELYRASEK